MNQKLLLWGCGERCKYILQQKMLSQEDVIGFIDGKPGRDSFFDKPVYSPESVREKLAMDSSIHILVTVRNAVLKYTRQLSILVYLQIESHTFTTIIRTEKLKP